jgi:hypothetical protein
MTKLSRANGAACCLAFFVGVLATGSTVADEAIAAPSINVDSIFAGVPAPAAADKELRVLDEDGQQAHSIHAARESAR